MEIGVRQFFYCGNWFDWRLSIGGKEGPAVQFLRHFRRYLAEKSESPNFW